MRQNMGDVRRWDVRFQHWVNDWEVELVGVFLHQLELHIPLNEDGDPLRWRLKKNGDFDIRSFFSDLKGSSSNAFPWKKKKKKHMWCKGFMSSCFLCLDSCMRIGKRVLQEII